MRLVGRLFGFISIMVLSGLVLVGPAADADAQQKGEAPLSKAQKNQIETIVKDYILKNPEIILEAIQTLRQREQAAARERAEGSIASAKLHLERDPTSPVAGNPKGDVVIVEFFDYRCEFCKRVFPSVQKLLKQDKNIRYVFKEFPILSPDSVTAARAALVAWKYEKDKYMAFHTVLMKSHGALPVKRVLRMAKKIGLDIDRIKREMGSNEISGILKRNNELARQVGVRGTPGFIIAGRLIPGAIDLKTLKKLVAAARGKS